MRRRTVVVNGCEAVPATLPEPTPTAPTPADTEPDVVARHDVHDAPGAARSTRAACTTHAPDTPQSGRPALDEPAGLMRTLKAVLRREPAMTQLATVAGVAVSCVWRLENGQCRPSEVHVPVHHQRTSPRRTE